ncbi:MAG: 50S ribosomal protein L11 methyltransferase [Desulfovibrio sp.]|nr:50S ribosomal protein L11 methyltransferase [Desulfovibrio sp.]
MPTLFQLTLLAKEEESENVTGLLALYAQEGWQEELLPTGETRFLVFTHEKQKAQSIEEAILSRTSAVETTLTEREEQDWLSTWKENFTPVNCGSRFVVLPPWRKDDYDARDRLPIIIEPKNAFGTGQHATTALCLTLLADAWENKQIPSSEPFLDLGTGSGILAIAAAKLGLSGKGLDIDADALENARENATQNQVAQKLQFLQGSIEEVQNEHFGLIFANILADPLIAMSQPIAEALGQKSLLILSGLLEIQAENVQKAYLSQGLKLTSKRLQDEWCALTFRKD